MAKNKPPRKRNKKYNPNKSSHHQQALGWGSLHQLHTEVGAIEKAIEWIAGYMSNKALRPHFEDPGELAMDLLLLQNDINRFRARRKAIHMLFADRHGVIRQEEDMADMLMFSSMYVELQNKVEHVLRPSITMVSEQIDRAVHLFNMANAPSSTEPVSCVA